MHNNHKALRQDIQALRAFAMGLVVFYHLWPNRLTGGFVGVDIFFVISGYLITGQLLREVKGSGDIALLEFWARRARRLLPSAIVVLLFSLALVQLALPLVIRRNNLQEIVASAVYLENWLLARKAIDYLASHDSASVVQHYWSLAVEEQFYLFWPFLVLLGYGRIGRPASAGDRRLKGLLWVVFAASLASSVYLTGVRQPQAFFSTITRGWEFAAGGLLSVSAWRIRGAAASIAMAAGLVLMVGSGIGLTEHVAFPGWAAVIPVVGAIVFLAAGEAAGESIWGRWLALRPLQWMGNHSYSLYLWHWPLIVAAPWLLEESGLAPIKIGILFVLPVLSHLTDRFIEAPVREGKLLRGLRVTYGAGALSALFVAGVGFFGYQRMEAQFMDLQSAADARLASGQSCYGAAAMLDQAACRDSFVKPDDLKIAFAVADKGPDPRCQQIEASPELRLCEYGAEKPARTVFVVGNSHAVRLVPALEAFGRSRGWRIVLAAKTNCTGLTGRAQDLPNRDNACMRWSQAVERELIRRQVDAVLFASHVDSLALLAQRDATAEQVSAAAEQVTATWRRLRQKGVGVVVTGDVPGTRPDSAPECIARSSDLKAPCAKAAGDIQTKNFQAELARQSAGLARYVDLHRYFCDESRCYSVIGGLVVYSDSHHLTGTYARSMGPYIGPVIESSFMRQPGT